MLKALNPTHSGELSGCGWICRVAVAKEVIARSVPVFGSRGERPRAAGNVDYQCNCRGVYAFRRLSVISSNCFSFSSRSPLFAVRLNAGWLILSFFAISMVLSPSFRCAQKHKSALALTV